MDGFAFLRRKEKFVASFRSAIHAFLLFQPLRWLKWLLVPGGKERELNIWRHDRPERGMWVHQLTCNRRDDHADKGVQCDLGDNASGRQPRVGFTGELCDGNSDVPRSRTPLLPDDAKLAEASPRSTTTTMPAPPSTPAIVASQIQAARHKYHRRDLRREARRSFAEIDINHDAVAAVDRPRSLRAGCKDDKSSKPLSKSKGNGTWGRCEEEEQEHARDVDEWRNWQRNTSEWGPSERGIRWTPRVLYTPRQSAQLNFAGMRRAHVELFFRENLREMGARLRVSEGEIAKDRTDSRIYQVQQHMMHIAILLFDDAAMTNPPAVENDSSQDDADSIS